MAGPGPGSFPLLVRGDWGTAEPPAALRKKLLLYFQSTKRSGGGECELRGGAGQLLVCFAQPDGETGRDGGGRQGNAGLRSSRVGTGWALRACSLSVKNVTGGALKKTNDFTNSELQEKDRSMEKSAEQSAETSPSVVLEHVEGCNAKYIQILLENVTRLAADDDFTVEMIPELNVAVATFLSSIDKRVKRYKITSRLLEVTRSIKVENIPDNVSTGYLKVYFESTQNGGGPVSDIRLFPEENSAIITFCDHKGNAASQTTWPALPHESTATFFHHVLV
uniref:Uncharacterized protein n=1 Tax=Coturnix japonica TaxID=93934 RepID=A0A8C2UGW8_COTJA